MSRFRFLLDLILACILRPADAAFVSFWLQHQLRPRINLRFGR